MKPQAMIDVIQAYMDNKRIQVKSHSSEVGWYTIKSVDNFNPDFGVCDYRVKPEPREFRICPSKDNDFKDVVVCTRCTKDILCSDSILVREVLE